MTQNDLVSTYIRGLPKLDLHCHLEGSVMPGELPSRCGSPPEPGGSNEASTPGSGEFMRRVHQRLTEEKHVVELLDLLAQRSADRSVIYREIMVTPHYFEQQGLAMDPLLEALRTGRERARRRREVIFRYVINIHTSQSPSSGERLVQRLEECGEGVGVVGVGVYGPENPGAATRQRPALGRAARAGLGRSIHFDRHDSPKPIWEALYTLGLKRLDHPLAALHDPQLLGHLRKIRMPVLLSVGADLPAPSGEPSGGYQAWDQHDIRVVPVSDAPRDPEQDLEAGLIRLARQLEWTVDRIDRLMRAGLEASFSPADLTATLRERFRDESGRLRDELGLSP